MIQIKPAGSFVKVSEDQAIRAEEMSVHFSTSLGTKFNPETKEYDKQGYYQIWCLNETNNGYFHKTIEDTSPEGLNFSMTKAHEIMLEEIKKFNPDLVIEIQYNNI